jgi:hypothetical protein
MSIFCKVYNYYSNETQMFNTRTKTIILLVLLILVYVYVWYSVDGTPDVSAKRVPSYHARNKRPVLRLNNVIVRKSVVFAFNWRNSFIAGIICPIFNFLARIFAYLSATLYKKNKIDYCYVIYMKNIILIPLINRVTLFDIQIILLQYLNLLPDEYHFFFKGRLLTRDVTLENYNVSAGSIIQVVRKENCNGGMRENQNTRTTRVQPYSLVPRPVVPRTVVPRPVVPQPIVPQQYSIVPQQQYMLDPTTVHINNLNNTIVMLQQQIQMLNQVIAERNTVITNVQNELNDLKHSNRPLPLYPAGRESDTVFDDLRTVGITPVSATYNGILQVMYIIPKAIISSNKWNTIATADLMVNKNIFVLNNPLTVQGTKIATLRFANERSPVVASNLTNDKVVAVNLEGLYDIAFQYSNCCEQLKTILLNGAPLSTKVYYIRFTSNQPPTSDFNSLLQHDQSVSYDSFATRNAYLLKQIQLIYGISNKADLQKVFHILFSHRVIDTVNMNDIFQHVFDNTDIGQNIKVKCQQMGVDALSSIYNTGAFGMVIYNVLKASEERYKSLTYIVNFHAGSRQKRYVCTLITI